MEYLFFFIKYIIYQIYILYISIYIMILQKEMDLTTFFVK